MIISPAEFDEGVFRRIKLQPRKGRRGPRAKKQESHKYKDVICAFDIETSKLPWGSHQIGKGVEKQDYIAFMYIWQFQVGKGITVMGRTWEEFTELLHRIAGALTGEERIVIYVHNLSFEWSFLHDERVLGPDIDNDTVFCLKPRRVCKFLACNHRLEFRCSYIHSNMGLDAFTRKMQVEHQKLSGEEFDYAKIRYPWTALTERELEYCANDVIGLVEALEVEMRVDGDDLYSIPLTSTGYVRRDIKKALQPRREYIDKLIPAIDTYKMLRDAFRGGDTHASRFYAGKTIPGPVRSVDRSSSYPDVQCNLRFPVSEFFRPQKGQEHDLAAMSDKIAHDRAVIMRITFSGLRLRNERRSSVPYLALAKCRHVVNEAMDNGRILSADYLETTMTDIDYRIVLEEYEFTDCHLLEWQYARYGPLPQEMRDVVLEYYRRKTELKGVEGQEIYYEKSKNKLNGIFGCSSQDPVTMTIHYDGNGEYSEGATIDGEFVPGSRDELEEILLDQARPVMPYQWGVWTTALARYELRKLIWTCGSKFIYADTDSCYFAGEVDFAAYNAEKMELSKKNGAYAADPAGVMHYMGMVEEDSKKGPYREFKTLGAKKYAYRDKAGDLHITISGVVKDEGARELERAGGLKAFRPGFTFRDAGGADVIYQDEPIGDIQVDGHTLYVGTGAVIVDSTYRLSLGEDYAALLQTLIEDWEIGIIREKTLDK